MRRGLLGEGLREETPLIVMVWNVSRELCPSGNEIATELINSENLRSERLSA